MRARRLLAIAHAEWVHNLRDPRSLFVIVALPIFMLLLYGYGINYDLRNIPFAVQDLDGTETSHQLLQRFLSSGYFSLREVLTDRARLPVLLDRGEVTFALLLPPGLSRELGAGRPAQVQIVLDGGDTMRANVAAGYIEGVVRGFSADLASDYLTREGLALPAAVTVRPTLLYNPDLKSVRFIVPGLIATLLTVLAALLTSTCLVREREWGSFESLVASPVQAREILLGKMAPYVAFAFADVLLCMAVGRWVFGVIPVGSVPLLLSISVLYLIASLSLGLLFSTLARTQQMAILLAMLSTLLPTILLSGFVFPLNSLPAPIRLVSNIVPATHFLIVIRAVYLKGVGLAVL